MQQETLERIFKIIDKLYENGNKINKICKILNDKNISSKNNGKWHHQAVKNIVERNIQKTWRIGGHTPYGFDVAENGFDYVENKKEQAVIQKMKDLQKLGYSPYQIANKLKNLEIKNKKNQYINYMSISRILNRPTKCIACGKIELAVGKLKCYACINEQILKVRNKALKI